MEKIKDLVDNLTNKDNKKAYMCLKELESESENSDIVYSFFDTLAAMIDDENSYVRTRALILIAENVKWDNNHKINKIIDKYLEHIVDDKPITARQCIKMLPVIVKYNDSLKEYVINALKKANIQKYKGSMQSLVRKDIDKILLTIEKM